MGKCLVASHIFVLDIFLQGGWGVLLRILLDFKKPFKLKHV